MPEKKIDYGDGMKVVEAEALSHQLVTMMSRLPRDDRMLLLERVVALLLLGPFSQGPQDTEGRLSPEEAHAIMEMYWGRFLSDVEVEVAELRLQRPLPPSPEAGS